MKRKIIFFIATVLLVICIFSSFCAYASKPKPEIYLIDYSEYCELLENGTFPENMLTFDKISFMGEFRYFSSISPTGVEDSYRYTIYSDNGNFFDLNIDHINENFADYDEYYKDYMSQNVYSEPTPVLYGIEHLDSENLMFYSNYDSKSKIDYTRISVEGFHYIYCADRLIGINTLIDGYKLNIAFNALNYSSTGDDFIAQVLRGEIRGAELTKLITGKDPTASTPETTPDITPEATTPEEQPKTGCAAFSFALPVLSAVLLAPIMIFIRKRSI